MVIRASKPCYKSCLAAEHGRACSNLAFSFLASTRVPASLSADDAPPASFYYYSISEKLTDKNFLVWKQQVDPIC